MTSPTLMTLKPAIQGRSPSIDSRASRMRFQPLAPLDTLFMYLIMSVTNLERHGASVGSSGSSFPLTAPAVVHFIKSVLLLPKGARLSDRDLFQRHSVPVLQDLLYLTTTQESPFSPSTSHPTFDAMANIDASGLPMHMNPCVSAQSLQVDVRVLHAMSLQMKEEPAMGSSCLGVQALLLQSWVTACSQHPPDAAVFAVMATSVVGLMHQCARQALHLMRRSEQAHNNRGKVVSTSKVQGKGQHEQRPKSAHKAAQEHGLAKPQASDMEGALWHFRTIMYLSTYFRSQHFPDRLLPLSGEERGCRRFRESLPPLDRCIKHVTSRSLL